MIPKKILIISPQEWGNLFVSKHNYAVALADMGHIVYFLNPPKEHSFKQLYHVKKINEHGVFVVDIKIPKWLYILRFKFLALYKKIVCKNILPQLNQIATWDEVWCFDANPYPTLQPLNAKKKILFIVDMPMNHFVKSLAISSETIFSISENILALFKPYNSNCFVINHGLSKKFVEAFSSQRENKLQNEDKINVGFVGNLIIGKLLNSEAIKIIVEHYPAVNFHFWGPYELNKQNTLTGEITSEGQKFINFLKTALNVTLYGPTIQDKIAKDIQEMDVFLVPYIPLNDKNNASNSHKIIEYLSTGKVIISCPILAYKDEDNLLETTLKHKLSFEELFKKIINNLEYYNSKELIEKRRNFALNNTYNSHVNDIYLKAYAM